MKTLSSCDFAIPEEIFAQVYMPQHVEDHFNEQPSEENHGYEGLLFAVALILAIYCVYKQHGYNLTEDGIGFIQIFLGVLFTSLFFWVLDLGWRILLAIF